MMITVLVIIFQSTGKSIAQIPTSNCKVCVEKDTYKIDPDSVLYLIRNFHNSFVKTSIFSNAGGYISFNPPINNATKKTLSSYNTLKLHWAYDVIGTYKRLSITMEQKNLDWKCDDGTYTGTPGVESENLYTSLIVNDIKPFGGSASNTIGTVEVLKDLLEKQNITNDFEHTISRADAIINNNAFSTSFQHIYHCRDIVFNNAKTGAVIQGASAKNGFIYFFGYDPRQDFHKLRLIIAGLDENNKIVFYIQFYVK